MTQQLEALQLVEVALMTTCFTVDAVIDDTENDDRQVERSHSCRYRQVLVGLEELYVAVVGRDGPFTLDVRPRHDPRRPQQRRDHPRGGYHRGRALAGTSNAVGQRTRDGHVAVKADDEQISY